jgi:hypothetical protein
VTLFDTVTTLLDKHNIPHAVIGAAALAVHGISRSTVDQDLLVTDTAVLNEGLWAALAQSTTIDIRQGDDTDPLAGVVRLERADERPVDIVVGRFGWQAAMLSRAERVKSVDRDVPVVRAADLVLLKLYAGGSQDRWDIEQLLAINGGLAIRSEVDSRIGDLPARCAAMWRALTAP